MHRGALYITLSALIWGLFPIVTSKSGTTIHPLWNSALTTLIAIIPCAFIMTFRKRWHELFNRQAMIETLISATLIGVCYYSLVFIGSSLTSPQNTAVLFLLEIVTTVILLSPFQEERLSIKEILGCIILLSSALLIAGGKLTSFTKGDCILIGASLLTPYGNLYAKRARTRISSETLLFVRCIWSGAILLALAAIFANDSIPKTFTGYSLTILIVTGIFMMALSKILWTEGVIDLKITSALALYFTIAPSVTFLSAFFLFGQTPSLNQLLALPLALIGAGVLFGFLRVGKRAVPPLSELP